MKCNVSNGAVIGIAIVHLCLMTFELLPWAPQPKIMALAVENWKDLELSPKEQHFASSIVHNAGIYNGIVAAGLLATLFCADVFPVQATLIVGGIVAGLFGAATLATATILQAVVGVVALGFLLLGQKHLFRTTIASESVR